MSIIKRERELVAVTAVGESDRDWFVCLTPVGFVWPEITASTRACGAGRLTPIPKDRVPEKPVVGQQYALETVRGSGVVGWGTGVGVWFYHRSDIEIRSDSNYVSCGRAQAALGRDGRWLDELVLVGPVGGGVLALWNGSSLAACAGSWCCR